MKKAADTILDCLKEKGMSQSQLAEMLGEDVRYLNQQLHRQKDMKVERFIDVLACIGFRVEIAENDGIKKVSKEYGQKVIEERKPVGLFWLEEDEEYQVAIDNSDGNAWTEQFHSKEECFKYLLGKPCITSEGISLNE